MSDICPSPAIYKVTDVWAIIDHDIKSNKGGHFLMPAFGTIPIEMITIF